MNIKTIIINIPNKPEFLSSGKKMVLNSQRMTSEFIVTTVYFLNLNILNYGFNFELSIEKVNE